MTNHLTKFHITAEVIWFENMPIAHRPAALSRAFWEDALLDLKEVVEQADNAKTLINDYDSALGMATESFEDILLEVDLPSTIRADIKGWLNAYGVNS